MVKKYVAILKDKTHTELMDDLLQRHVDHLRTLNLEGKLFICGPFRDRDQAMQILLCRDIEEAKFLVESDPFIKEGYYTAYDLNELIEANEQITGSWILKLEVDFC